MMVFPAMYFGGLPASQRLLRVSGELLYQIDRCEVKLAEPSASSGTALPIKAQHAGRLVCSLPMLPIDGAIHAEREGSRDSGREQQGQRCDAHPLPRLPRLRLSAETQQADRGDRVRSGAARTSGRVVTLRGNLRAW